MENRLDVKKLVAAAQDVISYGSLNITTATMMEVQKVTLDSGKVVSLLVLLADPEVITEQFPFNFPLRV